MKRLWTIGAVWLAAGIAWAAPNDDTIYSRQKAFRIPFQIPDPSEQKQLEEVQLYYARDGGPWQKYTAATADVPPEKRSFVFRAEQDGEYTFAVRTMDKRRTLNPADEADLQVGLRVVVDSEAPVIELRAISGSGREVGVEWDVQDLNLELDSLKMEYRVEGQEKWQPVPGVVPKLIGQATWTPDGPGAVTVRCQVQDRAKNLGIRNVQIPRGSAATRPVDDAEIPIGDSAHSRSKPNWLSGLPGDRSGQPSAPATSTDSTPGKGAPEQRLGGIANEPTESPAITDSSAAGQFDATRGSRYTPPAGSAMPVNRQVVRDREVSIDYEIDDVGPSGISIVELWVTRDKGRTWERLADDPDRQSPIRANLGSDGLYGLTLVARSGVGLGDRPPASGDEPQSWVEIDATPPTVELFAPEVGRGQAAGTVVITWSAQDGNLDDRCVSLYYTEGAKTDWKPIVTNIENSGRYVWKAGAQMPSRFRLAIDVVDRAGNQQTAESNEITLDTSKPRPRISSINSGGYR